MPQAPAPRTEGRAQSNFSVPADHPRENQIRQVGAGEEQNAPGRRLKQEKEGKRKHVEFFPHLEKSRCSAGIRPWILLFEPVRKTGQYSAGPRNGDSGFEPGKGTKCSF